MNKKVVNFFSSYGLTLNGKGMYGKINGYETNVTLVQFDNVTPLRMHISFYATDEQKRAMETAIRNLALKFFSMTFTKYGIGLGFNGMTLGALLKRLPPVLEQIFGILSANGALTSEFCPVCGNPLEEGNFKTCQIGGATITIDNDCVDTINKVISAENEDFNNAPNNCLRGFIGAVIGALAGVAIAVLLYVVGFVSSLSAVVSIVLGSFLYQKFHGKPNKLMIIIVSVTTLVFLSATVPVVYIVAAGIIAKSEGYSYTAMEAFRICMQAPEFSRIFYADLALVVLFTALGMGLQIATLAKKIRRDKNI